MIPVRVLISENCRDYANLLSQRLSMYPDIEIVGIAGDGETTLDMLSLLQPDVLLLDIVMPCVDGLEVLRRMQEASQNIVTYVISALGNDAIISEALSLGARHYFIKPFKTDLMAKRICAIRRYH